MTLEIILRYIHFISIFAIVSSLVSEHLLLAKTLTRLQIRKLSRIDAVYGVAAVTLLSAGLTLWLTSIGKPSFFYTKNWIFHTKITLFTIVGLLSVYPTVFFIRNGKGNPAEMVSVPSALIWMLRLELTLLAIIPLLAGLMAHGIGYFGGSTGQGHRNLMSTDVHFRSESSGRAHYELLFIHLMGHNLPGTNFAWITSCSRTN